MRCAANLRFSLGSDEDRRENAEAEGLGGHTVDHWGELHEALYRQVLPRPSMRLQSSASFHYGLKVNAARAMPPMIRGVPGSAKAISHV